jgi:regulator of sigma E protease
MITILSFFLVISVIVFIHELGHFLAARSVGVRVEKFYLGFNFFGLGWKKIYKGTEYGIGLFPLGGYVKVAGIIDESMDTKSTGAHDEFRSKNMWQKIWIMSAGVIMNFLLAIAIFTHLTYHNGIDEPDSRAIVGKVYPEYPAEKLGLKENDEILSINDIEVSDWNEMTREIHSRPNEEIHIKWMREGIIFNGSTFTTSNPQLLNDEIIDQGMIGIMPVLHHQDATLLESIKNGCNKTFYILDLTFRSLKALVKGNVSIKEMAGPIMIAKIAGDTASAGINALLGLMAFISVNLGFFNILPIPGLDGGHIFIAVIEGIIRRDLPLKVKMGIQQAGLLILLMLFITIMVNDIQRLIQ